MAESTIFDDVFRTETEKMPELTIPLINEAFGTNYPSNVEIIQGRNEQKRFMVCTGCSFHIPAYYICVEMFGKRL